MKKEKRIHKKTKNDKPLKEILSEIGFTLEEIAIFSKDSKLMEELKYLYELK